MLCSLAGGTWSWRPLDGSTAIDRSKTGNAQCGELSASSFVMLSALP
jgi:hypothetical protein